MTTYERVVDGRVVERVTPVFGDHEDTRLGCAALDRKPGEDGWRVQGVDDVAPAEPSTAEETAGIPPVDTTTQTPAEPDKPTEEVDHGADRAPRSDQADRRRNRPHGR